MTRRTLFSQIFSTMLLFTIVLLLFVYFFIYSIVQQQTTKDHYAGLTNIAAALAPKLTHFPIEGKLNNQQEYFYQVSKNTKTRITIVAPDGLVLLDTDKKPSQMDNHSDRPEIIKALNGHTGQALRYSQTLGTDMLYFAMPIYDQNKIIAVLRVSHFISAIEDILWSLKTSLLTFVLTIIFISLLFSFWAAKIIASPIRKLAEATNQVSQGALQTRIHLHQTSELNHLSASFNTMTEKISALIEELSIGKEEISGIITSINDGLITLDNKGTILLVNPSFYQIINTEKNLSGLHYLEAFSSNEMFMLIETFLKEPDNAQQKEITFGQKKFLCSFAWIQSKKEAVLLFHDITDYLALQNLKKEFVSNVSHELRTPLTAIKGFSETLINKEQDTEKSRYLSIILRHTDRLINMVKDLLLLAKLENDKALLRQDLIDMSHLVENVITIFKPILQQKKISFNAKNIKHLPPFKGDLFLLEQLFINLIDNAIKYTDHGKISLKAKANKNGIYFRIKDTGIGIPEDQLPKIFERFFVVDKSRSRQSGGTGLGLSIVKHIIELHQGAITTKSRPQKGTTFNIFLPK